MCGSLVRVANHAIAACFAGFIAVDSFTVPSSAQSQSNTTPDVNARRPSGTKALPTIVVRGPKPRPKSNRRPSPPQPAAAPVTQQDQGQQTTDRPGSSVAGAGLGGRFTGYTVDFTTPAVTTKDNTPILQVPSNVQVVPRQVMDDHQDISVRDAVVSYVSSLQPPSVTSDSNNFYDGFNIRGFDNANIFRNDLRVWEITGIETANLQSMEILKGPAAMLFGRLEPGGVINLVPKQPLDTPYAFIQQQIDSWGQTRTTLDSTGPISTDKTWLYRLNFDY
jgi:iron complex outermembrane recepter protein